MSPVSLNPSPACSPDTSPHHDDESAPHHSKAVGKTAARGSRSHKGDDKKNESGNITKSQIAQLVSARLKPFYKKEITKDEFIHINQSITRRIFPDFADASGSAPTVLDDLRRRVKSEVNEELHLC